MTPPVAATAECPTSCCPIHPEFAKRLDDRWDSHLEAHDRERSEVCRKMDTMNERMDKLNTKISIMAGAGTGIGFLLGLLIDKLKF